VAILNDEIARQGITVHRLHQMVEGHVSRSQLYDILRAKRTIDLAELEAICDALDVSYARVIAQAYRESRIPPEPPTSEGTKAG
jgi:hypothetical protein